MDPGSVGPPLPGIDATVVDANGEEVQNSAAGYLVLERPWPGIFRPVGSTDDRAMEHWTEFGDRSENWVYFTEDGATIDEESYITILGRLDDVINIGYFSKNRVHVSELERVIEEVDVVKSAAVVAVNHDIKGEAPYAFVIIEDGSKKRVREIIREHTYRAQRPLVRGLSETPCEV